ncbi:MAG: AraC family transcriptional regulator [Deltaproteobacteria bacterium]|nr:AraC family transcriptional regulator [Deltaproteobacteria bacterium]
MSLVRAEGLRGYWELVTELGGDADALLAAARLPPAALEDPENFVPYTAVNLLLEKTARSLDCPDFGLRLSQRQDVGILGPLAVAMQNSGTVGEALACASRYIFVHSPAIAFSAQPATRADRVLVVFELLLERAGSTVQATELSLGLAARVVSLLAEGRHHLMGVQLPHSRLAPLDRYRAHFAAPVSFECDDAALEFLEADLSLPIPSGSRELRELANDYLELHYATARTPFSVRVQGVVRRSMGTGRSDCVDVASALAVHPRTLQRRLREEGTRFEQIKDEVRADLARRYLAQAELPLSQVAGLLDYSEQSAFTRSCRRWFGRPPRALRGELM